jgi:hypothetical protein
MPGRSGWYARWQRRHAYTNVWNVGLVARGIERFAAGAPLTAGDVRWLPALGGHRFIADPFALRRDGRLWIFHEYLDYATRIGEIRWTMLERPAAPPARTGVALRLPVHASYPFLVEDGGELYMIPETHKAGEIALYVAERFPDRWARVGSLLREPGIDPTVVRHDGVWWLFYTLPGPERRSEAELRIASAPALRGPWRPHRRSPAKRDLASARPGGTPFVQDGALYRPAQDCAGGYGAGIAICRVDVLTPDDFCEEVVARMSPVVPYATGLHTLSRLDDTCSLVDGRAEHWTPTKVLTDLRRVLWRPLRRLTARAPRDLAR